MFNCLGRIGCAVILLILGAIGWHYRDVWMPKARGLITAEMPWDHAEWTRVSEAGAARAAARMDRLRGPTGPAYVNVSGADFASWALRHALPGIQAVDSFPEALLDDGILYLRLRVKLADLGNREQWGAVASMFGDDELLTIAGQVEYVRSGLARYRPTDVALRDIRIPGSSLIRLLTRWSPGVRPDSVGGDALPVPLPQHVADLRISGRRVTLYKAAT